MTVQAPGAPLTRVAVHLGARRLDVALDAARTLGELLAAAGTPHWPRGGGGRGWEAETDR